MGKLNTKAFALFIKSGSTLPTPPANYIELSEKLLLAGKPTVEEYSRFNGRRNAFDSHSDTSDTTVEGVSLAHKMRYQNSAGDALDTIPEYAELLKIAGFTETVDTTTPGQETVTYTLDTSGIPPKGSAVYYMDGKKLTMTNSIALDLTFDFEIGKAAMLNASLSAFVDNNGIAVNEANPEVTLLDEPCLMCGYADLFTKGGTSVAMKSSSISLNSTINKEYGFGEKEYSSDDTNVKINCTYNVEDTNYNEAINALQNETYFDLVIKLGTNAGAEVSGKTVVITITNVKFSDFSDSDNNDKLQREDTLLMTAKSTFTIKTGYFS